MKKNERLTEILEILTREKKVEVVSLSERLAVSQVTIRKDLDELEEKGVIRRVHGYAQLLSTDNINGRLAYHYEAKQKIARKAADLIQDGDTIMIESGSCCALLAATIAREKKNVTIVTNSAFIADYIRHLPVQTVLLGGIYQPSSQCLVGPMVKQAAQLYSVHYFFAGTDGWNAITGFSNKDQMRCQAVRDMSQSAQEMVILTESEKFKDNVTIAMHIPDQPKIAITDDRLSEDIKAQLDKEGIQVITA
ncbi:MAG: DeoR/GlpR family DNA-binding transcription regulator [Lactimicrobium sp.]|jgi:DeoR/GlpR family transcriptional regulator of sugar metabolism|uniref:DeoR/GlpR family DNA-binding transcription regulator n=1 Tax=Lactimicrobium sp. TaxID=2563780 RepID=UPI002F360C64